MEVKQVLRMNGGNGETSYAKNSQLQNKMISQTRPITEAAIVDFYRTTFSHSISIADLGCSSGPNTLMFVWEIIEAIQKVCSILGRPLPELRFFLNDLPGNDFNTIFKSLPEFHMKLMNVKGIDYGECFIAGVPGTFYGRLFPSKSLDFVHSSSSLHWLSRVPPELDSEADTPLNKGKIYISKTSPSCVLNAYLVQFQKDFSLFLKSRSKEVVAGGRMVLSFLGRLTSDPTTEESCLQWELLAHALNEMVLENLQKTLVISERARQMTSTIEGLESERDSCRKEKDACFKENEGLTGRLKEFEEKAARLSAEVLEATARSADFKAENRKLVGDVAARDSRVAELEAELRKRKAELKAEVKRRKVELKNDMERLEKLKAEYETVHKENIELRESFKAETDLAYREGASDMENRLVDQVDGIRLTAFEAGCRAVLKLLGVSDDHPIYQQLPQYSFEVDVSEPAPISEGPLLPSSVIEIPASPAPDVPLGPAPVSEAPPADAPVLDVSSVILPLAGDDMPADSILVAGDVPSAPLLASDPPQEVLPVDAPSQAVSSPRTVDTTEAAKEASIPIS